MTAHYQPRKAWSIAFMMFGLQLVNFVDKVAVGLVAVPMMAELNLSPVQFGIVAGSIFWLFALGGLAGGFMANRIPTRWLLLGMAVAWSVVQLPIAMSSSLVMIVIARVLLGLAEGPSAAVATHGLFKWFPNDKRNLPAALLNMGSTFGVLVAGIGIPLITAHWGWRANFWALAAIGFVWAALWLVFGAEGKLEESAPTGSGKQAAAGSVERVPYLKLLRDRTVIGVCLVYFAAFWGIALGLTWLPAYLSKGLGFDPKQAGQLFALIVALSAPISIAVCWFSQRRLARGASSRAGRALVGSVALMLSGFIFAMPQWLQLGVMQKVVLFAVAVGLAASIPTLTQAMMAEVSPVAQRGAMLAVKIAGFGSVAGILAPVITGWLIERSGATPLVGYEWGFALSGVLAMAGGALGLVLLNPERSRLQLRGLAPQAALA